MNKFEKIKATIEGKDTDTIPYAFWTHLPGIDLDPHLLAKKTYEFYKRYNIDFIKTMNNGMYPIEDLGCTIDYSEIVTGGVAKLIYTPIKSIEDWGKVTVTSIEHGALKRELYSLELLIQQLKSENVPVVFTVFSPLTTAYKISGTRLLEHIQNSSGKQIHQALDHITQTTCTLVRRAIELGASGIFFASQMSNYDVMDESIYREFGVPYDIQVLQASQGWFNVLHAHGSSIMFELLKDYPVDVFNWHVWESLPKLDEAQALTGKCLMGGLCRMDITNRNKNNVRSQIYRSIKTLGGRGLILTPGCVIRYPLDERMLDYVRTTKEEVEKALKTAVIT